MQSSNMKDAIAARDEYQNEYEREAFASGYDHAHGIACHNVPIVGREYWIDGEGKFVPEDIKEARYLHATLCYDAEMNARCFSPWEYTAHEINSLGEFESESAWEAYENGVSLAIAHDLARYTDSDYSPD